jgi:hypothetical protein
MASKALHAAWRRSTSCGVGWICTEICTEMNALVLDIMCVDRGVLVSMRRPRLGPRLERTHALCGPCVSRTGFSPSLCGRRTRAEPHIQDIGPRMLPSSAAPRRRASCRHPCCSFPCSALRAHGTLHSPDRGSTPDFVLRMPPCALYTVHKKFCHIGPGRSEGRAARRCDERR